MSASNIHSADGEFNTFLVSRETTFRLGRALWLTVLLFIVFLLCIEVLFHTEKRYIVDEPLAKADVIVVLGSPVASNGTISPLLRSRVDKAIQLYQQDLAPRIIFTGSAVANQWVEAEIMAGYAEKVGVPKEAIVIEPRARTTKQNAVYSTEIMKSQGWQSALVVTSPAHTRRAKRRFEREGIDARIISAPYARDVSSLTRAVLILHEVLS